MKQCPNCRSQVQDNTAFCPVCGTTMSAQNVPYSQQRGQNYQDPYYNNAASYRPVDPHDHTSEFDMADISKNKLYAMLCYLMGFIGIAIALLGAKESSYVQFHVRQALKLTVVQTLLSVATAVLFWTILVPIVGGVALTIVTVLQYIAFFQVCQNKAKEPGIISSLNFLN